MSDLSIFSTKFNINSKTLKEFDDSLRYLKKKRGIIEFLKEKDVIHNLSSIINPIAESIEGELTDFTLISERNIIEILKEWHNYDWQTYKQDILKLKNKLKLDMIELSQSDFQILNDIADALDAECQSLFRRMGER